MRNISKDIENIRWEESGIDNEIFLDSEGVPYAFEAYNVEDPDDYYVEGTLEIEGNEILDYDGVFGLPQEIEDKLNELGYEL